MPFTLPALPYAFNALEPVIDALTMEIHSQKHHAAYVTNANKALEGTKWADMPAEQVITQLGDLPEDKRGPVRNNLGGHVNHSMFWTLMAPPGNGGGGSPSGELASAIDAAFGGLDAFKTQFAAACAGRFGSGWAWLCWDKDAKKLAICSTPNQDNPLMGKAMAGCAGTPILGLDVWEHAYYLKYQNRRPDYVAAWWGVVNWAQVAKNLAAAK
ncbi:MAG TPA: superoxide dismutase [Phycisphaerales bacterium]|nr:superoxide dismutase [Phycisphaerales bacterium]